MKLTHSTCPVTGRHITLRTITPAEHETSHIPLCADGTQAEPYIEVSPSINYDTAWHHRSHQPHTHAAIQAPTDRDPFFDTPEPTPPRRNSWRHRARARVASQAD
ncbi:MAG: hypothetical protein WCD79_01965 [Chthoniobacteraceae bacterium]